MYDWHSVLNSFCMYWQILPKNKIILTSIKVVRNMHRWKAYNQMHFIFGVMPIRNNLKVNSYMTIFL